MSEETTTPVESTPELPKLKFGFAIVVDLEGNVFIERNTDVLKVDVERPASLLEVRRYLSEILMDLEAQSAAEYVMVRLAAKDNAVNGDPKKPE
jgi:hypothetical protein